jgi:mono/diheme cytochrome c family protein
VRTTLAAALALVAVLVAAGCGTGGLADRGDASSGKPLFVQKCGSCHTLADAGTKGVTGPNLDDAFGHTRSDGFEESTIFEVVEKQMKYPIPPMPPDTTLFPDENDRAGQRADVAAYVAAVAGVPPKAGATTSTSQAQQPAGGGAADGKSIFTSAGCTACHTLKDAGATGTVGPNLDVLKPDAQLAERQVRNGGGGMPPYKGQLSDEEIAAVAAYVADATSG